MRSGRTCAGVSLERLWVSAGTDESGRDSRGRAGLLKVTKYLPTGGGGGRTCPSSPFRSVPEPRGYGRPETRTVRETERVNRGRAGKDTSKNE